MDAKEYHVFVNAIERAIRELRVDIRAKGIDRKQKYFVNRAVEYAQKSVRWIEAIEQMDKTTGQPRRSGL